MSNEPDIEQGGSADEAEFEASLIADADVELTEAETKIVEAEKGPSKGKEEAPAGKQPAWAGKVLGHFKLLRLLGEGKMGRVIQAKDINLQRIVALKILRKRIPWLKDSERVRQFLQEARAAAQIEHPNVVRIYEINQHDGWWYIAMEMLEGENIRRLVSATGPLRADRACRLLADAAAGLAVAHSLGIIHRDVKPTNLMLTRHGRCKVTDFGLVRLDDPSDPFDLEGKIVGSPPFIAPEVISRGEQTAAIDIYSLGATLYYALTGKAPYSGKELKQILRKHLEAPVPDIRRLLPGCSASLASLVGRAMAKEPSERPTATDFAAALRAEVIMWQSEHPGNGTPGGSGVAAVATDSTVLVSPEPVGGAVAGGGLESAARILRSRRTWAAAAVAAGLIVAVVILLSLFGRGGGVEPAPEIVDLGKYFPGAVETYGVLPPGARCEAAEAGTDEPPGFSWVGKVDTTGRLFAASKSGRYFYAIDDPDAALIRTEDLITYQTAAEARADGRIPAP